MCISTCNTLPPVGKPTSIELPEMESKSELLIYLAEKTILLQIKSKEAKQQEGTNVDRGGDFPGALNSFCSLNMGHGSSPVEKSTAGNMED